MLLNELSDPTINELLGDTAATIKENMTLDAALERMLNDGTREAAVVDTAGTFRGTITLAQAVRMAGNPSGKEPNLLRVSSLALTPGPTADSKEKASEILLRMEKDGLDSLPVLREGTFMGMVRKEDVLLQIFSRKVENLSAILHAIHESICVVNKDGKVAIWSKGSEKLLGISAEKIVGHSLADFFPDALLLRVIKEKKELKNYYHSPRKGQYVVVSAMPLFFGGEFIGAVSTDKDATEATRLIFELEETRDKLKHLQDEVSNIEDRYSFDQVVGKSTIIKEKITRARQVARTKASVLITGESGTGKEVFARAVHRESGRGGPFVAVNCSAIPESLFESEMFGYVGGAFTGALKKGKLGKFELAHGGTLFFDEIGDMPLYMQAKILRALQERNIVRVGAENPLPVDVRVVSATHHDLDKLVLEEKFREDLYYRLNVVKINLPPLRKRKEDIPLLVKNFTREFCSENNLEIPQLTPEVLAALMSYNWRGNIRELKNTVEHLVIFSRGGKIEMSSAPEFLFDIPVKDREDEDSFDLEKHIARTEIELLDKVMGLAGGNKSKAAKLLNVPRSTLYYKLNFYNIK